MTQDAWTETTLDFRPTGLEPGERVDEIRFLPPRGTELLVDDILLFEPGVDALAGKDS